MDRNYFQENRELRNIIDHLTDAIYLIDSEGVILFMNKAAEKLDGYSLREIKGRTIMDVYNLDETQSPLLRVALTKEPLTNHFLRYYINDQEVFQLCNTFPVEFDDGTTGSVSIQRDYTKLNKVIKHNINLQKELFDFEKDSGKNSGKLYNFNDIIGEHQLLRDCKNLAYNASQSDSPIMISGATGTGKELFAQSIHSAGRRKNEPFLAINCAAIPETLLESLLFGTKKGIYTGATDRKGLFEEANGGTLFLDEINSMPLSSQSKLLRVLEEKEVQPLGSKERIRIDTRVISGCNEPPSKILNKNIIRPDLFYRLAVININIPPLSQRKSDIFLLAHHFIAYYNDQYHKNILAMEDEITTFFLNYDWPGNVRQLRSCIECAVSLASAEETTIKEKHLPFYLLEKDKNTNSFYRAYELIPKDSAEDIPDSEATPPGAASASLPPVNNENVNIFKHIESQEKTDILNALLNNNGCISKAARELGWTRQTLVYRMKKHDIKKALKQKESK
ncbi:MAG: sigma 54-interacting transcriptional regulator [Bacillota bacterium]|nr:sigma 54-interacting transcriptional regulator [Bacillota bacterium]